MKLPSQCDRVLAVLIDGEWHSITEIHARAGTMRLNSRVAELRKRGHEIVCERSGRDYRYQLRSLRESDSRDSYGSNASPSTRLDAPEVVVPGTETRPSVPSGSRSESDQLTLDVAA